ncbi:MAG: hypothetical protein ACYC5G_02190 [Candidatus Doudnabacteria bacterium]
MISIVNKTGLAKDTEILNEDGSKIRGAYKVEFGEISTHSGLIEAAVYFQMTKININIKDGEEFFLKETTVFGDKWKSFERAIKVYDYELIVNYIERDIEKPQCRPCRDLYSMKGVEPPCDICLPKISEDNISLVKAYYILSDQIDLDTGKINQVAVWKYIDNFQLKNKTEAFEIIIKLLRNSFNINKK